jgi:hypothetical protein
VLFAAVSVATAAVALVLTWRRLFIGMDLQDESYYILVPWRWALGDKPFIDEENLAQVAGFLEYPFIKVFEVLRGGDVTGLVLYGRHLYLVLMLLVATAVFLALRRLVRWELALPVAVVYVTYIFWETPQLSYNTMAGALLSLGAALGVWVVVHGGGRRWAFGSGLAFGLAVVAYPTLLFVMPFVAVFLALSLGAGRSRTAYGQDRVDRPQRLGRRRPDRPGAHRAVHAQLRSRRPGTLVELHDGGRRES